MLEKITMKNAIPEISHPNPSPEQIAGILERTKKIAIIGISPKESRDSNRVARYLMEQGYEVVPVNPGQREILGKACFKTIQDIPFPVDMANLFLNPARVLPVVDQAVKKAVPVIWMQESVVHNEAAQRAREADIQVVMNLCIMKEHKKWLI
ncbi:MAG: CoA-binding protein [Deltaproteobacteria bacterium]|nr:CoA-binding protein [Deltaproteobacteria bacterium]